MGYSYPAKPQNGIQTGVKVENGVAKMMEDSEQRYVYGSPRIHTQTYEIVID